MIMEYDAVEARYTSVDKNADPQPTGRICRAGIPVRPSNHKESILNVRRRTMRVRTSAATALAVLGVLVATPASHADTTRTLLASDEFTGAAGSTPSRSNWTELTGGSGWGNNELQSYTTRTSNASLDGSGHLQIVARKETYTGVDGIRRDYTSARLYSNVSMLYGYIEARIYLPSGQGLWPAFWTLGSDVLQGVPWPKTGEIDIMEAENLMPKATGSIHGPTTGGGAYAISAKGYPATGSLAASWHTYAINWTSTGITWYLDGVAFNTITKAGLPAADVWEFSKPHLVQLNLAVGGDVPGAPTSATVFPATMLVDWVRYYSN